MVILEISEIKLLNIWKTRKILKTIIHLDKKIFAPSFCGTPYAGKGVEGEQGVQGEIWSNSGQKTQKTHR